MRFIDNLPIQKKMLFLVATLLLMQMLTSGFGAYKIHAINKEFDRIQQEALPLTELNADITVKQLEMEVLLERLLRSTDMTGSAAVDTLHKKIRALSMGIDQQIAQADTLLQNALNHPLNDTLKTEMVSVKQHLSNIKNEHQQFDQLVAKIITAIKQEHTTTPQQINQVEQSEQLLNQHLNDMLVEIEHMSEDTVEKVHHDEQSALSNLLIFSVISLLIGVLLSQNLSKKITTPIYDLIDTLTTMSKNNDLTLRMDDNRRDEMGQLATTFNQFAHTLQQLIHNIDNASHQLASAAEETSTVIQLTGQEIDEQKNGTIQVASAINEMTASVQEVAFNAEKASQSANSSDNDTQGGKAIVQDMVYAIDALAQEISSSSDILTLVKTSSENIGRVLDVINNIAEQTNLLALNAAIEAARAGEQGRGFAVVADEVRSLAQKTQGSTHEIESLIGTLQQNSDNAVNSMNKNQSGVQSLINKANSATASLNAISDSVRTISEMNIQIASAAEQQSQVVSEINQNITAIQQISENTAVGSKQITGASEEIAQLSAQLRLMVQRFKVD